MTESSMRSAAVAVSVGATMPRNVNGGNGISNGTNNAKRKSVTIGTFTTVEPLQFDADYSSAV